MWVDIDRSTKLLLAYELGDRGKKTVRRLYGNIKGINCRRYYSDNWKAYTDVLPVQKHTASKKEAYTIEGDNSLLRHYLARFRRKTKCYSKSKYMVEVSLKSLFHKLNNKNNCSTWLSIPYQYSQLLTLCLTSRGSLVRVQHVPLSNASLQSEAFLF